MKKVLFIVITILTALNTLVDFWWLYNAFRFDDFNKVRTQFFSVFPISFRNPRQIGLFFLLTSLGSLIVLFFLHEKRYLAWKLSLLIINLFLFTWNLWGML